MGQYWILLGLILRGCQFYFYGPCVTSESLSKHKTAVLSSAAPEADSLLGHTPPPFFFEMADVSPSMRQSLNSSC